MKNEIYQTETFSRLVSKLPNDEKKRISKIQLQLQDNAFIGKPLGFSFFREKYVNSKRVYYLLYVEVEPHKVLLVAYGTKKQQQEIIDFILEFRVDFKRFLQDNYRIL